jgi:Tfp pilus assembly protein PilF
MTVQQIDPQSPEAFNALASLAAYEGSNDEAKTLYEKAIAIASDNVEARIGLAKIFIKEGKYPDAELQLRSALETDPGNADALATIVPLLKQQKKEAEAIMYEQEMTLLR